MHPRTLLALALVLASPGDAVAKAKPLPPAVAIDARSVSDADFSKLAIVDLQSRLALRLTQAGYAVVGRAHQPMIAVFLQVSRTRDGKVTLVLRVASASQNRLRRVPRGKGRLAAFHLEAIHKAIEAVRAVEAAIRSASSGRAKPPAPAPEQPPTLRTRRRRGRAAAWPALAQQVGFLVLATHRAGGTDLMFRLGGRHRLFHDRFGLRWSVRYGPSSVDVSGAELSISEWGIEAGADWRFDLRGGRLQLALGLVGGFLLHQYSFTEPGAEGQEPLTETSGTRWDASATLFAELCYRLTRRVSLAAWLAGGISEDERQHSLTGGTAPIWERSRLRVEAGGGLRFAL